MSPGESPASSNAAVMASSVSASGDRPRRRPMADWPMPEMTTRSSNFVSVPVMAARLTVPGQSRMSSGASSGENV